MTQLFKVTIKTDDATRHVQNVVAFDHRHALVQAFEFKLSPELQAWLAVRLRLHLSTR